MQLVQKAAVRSGLAHISLILEAENGHSLLNAKFKMQSGAFYSICLVVATSTLCSRANGGWLVE